MTDKAALRRHFRAQRRAHVEAQPPSMRALLFLRPPVPVARRLPASGTVGLYHPQAFEAPTRGYARWLHENGYALALPAFAERDSPMAFRTWSDPYAEDELVTGPFGVLQPPATAPSVLPEVLFMPLIAFTAAGERLGQGGGHYDRWLAAHPTCLTIGLAWDAQLADSVPIELHDRPLDMVITPTRLYEGAR